MEHIAIMNSKWWFLKKILTWEKIIESRWYKTNRKELNIIKKWDNVFFKDSWKPITLKTKAKEIKVFKDLNENNIKNILDQYWKDIWITNEIKDNFYENVKDSKYCLLIFLEKEKEILEKPFHINKKWFWNMTAFISIEDIEKIKK